MIQRKTLKLFNKIAKLVEPPPDILVSKWVEDNRVLSKESSAEPGRYRVSRAPYQEEIQDSINDPKVSHVRAFGTSIIRPIIMIGYCSNELLSIIENGEACGFIPKPIAQFLAQYQKKLSSLAKFNSGGE